jgi:hypothetical protein
MPYSLSLKEFVLPEFEAEPPSGWEKRLREISPKLSNASHLRFRKFAPRDDWKESPFNLQPDRPLWALYTALPIRLVEPLTAEGFRLHWSEQPTEGEKVATKALVSDYQHFLWHSQGLYVKPFWLLQGEWGGTPMKFTDREKRYLDGAGQSSIPAPPGAFTPCVFDERAVKAILIRDRLLEAGKRFDELDKMDSPESKKAEDDQAELVYRETVLQTLAELAQPAVSYMQSAIGKSEISSAVTSGFLKPAPTDLPDTLSVWREHFVQHGVMLKATPPKQRKVLSPLTS